MDKDRIFTFYRDNRSDQPFEKTAGELATEFWSQDLNTGHPFERRVGFFVMDQLNAVTEDMEAVMDAIWEGGADA